MKLNVKTRIRYNGQEYSDPNQLPPEVRAAYEKALQSKGQVKNKFIINGEEFGNESEMPDEVGRLCADVMSVLQNNGHVTIPASDEEGLLTKRQIKTIGSALGVLVLVTLLILAKRLA